MSAVAKQAYYGERGMVPGLAARYFEAFGNARRVLDVGCGTGELGRYRPRPDVEVHGVDIDAGAVERARRFERAVRVDLETERLPYDAESFDAVLAKDILEHVRDPARLVREIHRVLRPNGVLVASLVMAKPRAVWSDYTHVRGFTQRAARLLLEDVGFEVEGVWRMGGVPLSSRLRFIDLVPVLLRLPVFSQLWASSWELKARKPAVP